MAGIWGEYTDCDTPFFTIENALQRVSQEHPDVSYWLMTGDLPPHDIWEYNRNETVAHIKFSSWLINHYSKDIGVFPVIGNHEAVPINR
jgi:sphingomyelin phosphodiesterase